MADRDYEKESLSVGLNIPYTYNNEDKIYDKTYNIEITVVEEDWDNGRNAFRDPIGIDYMEFDGEVEMNYHHLI